MRIATIIIMLFFNYIFAESKNLGFLMNQKYLCVNLGVIRDKDITPVMSVEEALKYPIRISVDNNNILQTDGIIKNLKHIEKTTYGNSETTITLVVEDNKRYIIQTFKVMNNIPILSSCIETDSWTLAK